MPAGCFQTTRQPEAVVAVAVEAAVLAVVVMDCWNPPRYQVPSLRGNITY